MKAYRKTENLLKNYRNYKRSLDIGSGGDLTRACVAQMDKAFESLNDNKYINIIIMHYLEGKTMEAIAEYYDISVVATYEQRKKLIKILSTIICSDEAIRELLEHE